MKENETKGEMGKLSHLERSQEKEREREKIKGERERQTNS